MQTTICAKIELGESYPILDRMGEHLGQTKRSLFNEFNPLKRRISEIKQEALVNYGITARQFNSLRVDIQGVLESYRELQVLGKGKLERRLKKKKRRLKKIKNPFKTHHLKRSIQSLEEEITRLERNENCASICFGGRDLFFQQFHLEENGYSSHAEWKEDWKNSRNSNFFLVGSKDESFGNQSCQLLPGRLKVRLTNKIASEVGQTTIEVPIEFTYQKNIVEHALFTGQAMNYRFIKTEGSWYVHLTTEIQGMEIITSKRFGALGIDLNPRCIAVTEIGPDGNLIDSWQFDVNLRGRRSNQITSVLADKILSIVEYAALKKLPIVIERLDFERKKEELRSRNLNRMLSSFSYSQFAKIIYSQCHRLGVELISVNPAYTSVIGGAKFSEGYGLSTHLAAAMTIARRGLGFGELLRKKARVRSSLPVKRNRDRHVWSDWRILSREAKKKKKTSSRRQRPERAQGGQGPSSSTPCHGPPCMA